MQLSFAAAAVVEQLGKCVYALCCLTTSQPACVSQRREDYVCAFNI